MTVKDLLFALIAHIAIVVKPKNLCNLCISGIFRFPKKV